MGRKRLTVCINMYIQIRMALTANEKVLTLDYWKLANKVEVGDYVFDRLGKPVRVTKVQQYRSENCYKVIFGDKFSVTGDLSLGFPIENNRFRRGTREHKGKRAFTYRPKYYTVRDQIGRAHV